MSSLSTEQAPPIFVPLRFFAIAPLFLILASLIGLFGNADWFEPHSPVMLAATHCITLGFIGMIMTGAQQQILPVVIGSTIPAQRSVAWFTYLPLIFGTLALAGGFMLKIPELLDLAWMLLGGSFLIFIFASLISLYRAQARNITRTAIFLSLPAIGLAVFLGALLARGYATGLQLDYESLSSMHIGMALGGWVTLLIAGVSYQVVPMFQLTPSYPDWLTRLLAPLLLLSLISYVSPVEIIKLPAQILFWLCASCFALVTLRLQSQRRRKIRDATLNFFRLAMVSLLLSCLFFALSLCGPAALLNLSVVLFILGFVLSAINGMLYKIVPFLVWFHLFRGGIKKNVPNMKQIIPEVLMWRHLYLHTAVVFAVLISPLWHAAIRLAAAGLAIEGVLLCYAMIRAIIVYRNNYELSGN